MSVLDFFQSREFWAAFISASATISVVYIGIYTIRNQEIKRLRIKCVHDLISYRFVLSDTYKNDDGRLYFFSALNAIPSLYGHNPHIINLLREFRQHEGDKRLSTLIELIRATAKDSGISLTYVSDLDLHQTLH